MAHLRISVLIVVLGASCLLRPTAAGALSVSLVTIASGSIPGETTYSYSASISGSEAMSPFPPPDFFTIYDIQGLVSATAPAGFSVSISPLGLTPLGETPADDPTLLNVTYAKSGTTGTLGPATFGPFVIVSTIDTTVLDNFSGEASFASNGTISDGTSNTIVFPNKTTGTLDVPGEQAVGVAEPGTMLLMAAGLAGLVVRRRTRGRANQ
jgi:hypothetical protein